MILQVSGSGCKNVENGKESMSAITLLHSLLKEYVKNGNSDEQIS